jgi:hypothetical protein
MRDQGGLERPANQSPSPLHQKVKKKHLSNIKARIACCFDGYIYKDDIAQTIPYLLHPV